MYLAAAKVGGIEMCWSYTASTRKLMDVGLINQPGWKASTPMSTGLATAYAEFKASNTNP